MHAGQSKRAPKVAPLVICSFAPSDNRDRRSGMSLAVHLQGSRHEPQESCRSSRSTTVGLAGNRGDGATGAGAGATLRKGTASAKAGPRHDVVHRSAGYIGTMLTGLWAMAAKCARAGGGDGGMMDGMGMMGLGSIYRLDLTDSQAQLPA